MKTNEFNNEYSTFSKLFDDGRYNMDKTYYTPYNIDPKFAEQKEIWPNAWPTRTDLTNFEDFEEEIIPIFGDSFMFGDGLPEKWCLSTLLNKKDKNKFWINLAKPGSGNETIMRRLEQWANEPKSEQTKTIVYSMSSMMRHAWYMNILSPGIDKPTKPIYNELLRAWDTNANINPNLGIRKMPIADPEILWELPEASREFHTNFNKRSVKAQKALDESWAAHMLHINTNANSFIKNVEIILRRLHWLTLAKKWNIIFVNIGFWEQYNRLPDAMELANKYINDMNTLDRKVEIINTPLDYSRLSCGHFDEIANKDLAENIHQAYRKINNG
jgi:hypothetical protein